MVCWRCHGALLDPNGRIVGRTIEGELVFNSVANQQETDPTRPGMFVVVLFLINSPVVPQANQKKNQQNEPEKPQSINHWFWKIYPPTVGHEKLLTRLQTQQKKRVHNISITLSRSAKESTRHRGKGSFHEKIIPRSYQ